jgi:hypothetical protein
VTALIIGTILAVAALGFVLYPLFVGQPSATAGLGTRSATDAGSAQPSGESRVPSPDAPVQALREIEFDRQTGKLSDDDYAVLKARYTREALALMREREAEQASAAAAVGDDELEAVILQYRARRPSCPTCGPRPETDALYCSTCGTYLAGACSHCGASIREPGARFCSTCGRGLAEGRRTA